MKKATKILFSVLGIIILLVLISVIYFYFGSAQ